MVTMCVITGWPGCRFAECGLPPECDVTHHPVPQCGTCEAAVAGVKL